MRLCAMWRADRLAAATALFVLGSVQAQPPAGYISDFEGLMASPVGVQLWDPAQPAGTLGQDNYYWPPGTSSVPHFAHTYAGNALSVPPNPTGGNIFIAGTGPAGGTFARAQRDASFGFDTGPWTFGTDILIQFNGTLPTAQNIGSFSTQPGAAQFIMLAAWVDPATAANWNANIFAAPAAGGTISQQTGFNPGFQNLNVNTWYRWETDIDLGTREITETRITDLTTGTTATHTPAPGTWFIGGAGNMTGFRFFAGGGVAGNTIAWDNPSICAGNVSILPPMPCPLGPCCFPPRSFRVRGCPQLGASVDFLLDLPAGMATPGSSLGGVAMSLAGGLPCVPFPGTNGFLIRFPALGFLLAPAPWAGPGTPLTISVPMPPNVPAMSMFIGADLFTQGAFLDAVLGRVVLTEGARLTLGG